MDNENNQEAFTRQAPVRRGPVRNVAPSPQQVQTPPTTQEVPSDVPNPMPDNQTTETNTTLETTESQNQSNKKLLLGIGIGAAVVIAGFMLFSGSSNSSAPVSSPPSSAVSTPAPSPVTSPPAPITPPKPVYPTGYVTGDDVIVRARPAVSADRVTELNRNTRVTILDTIVSRDSQDAILTERVTMNYRGNEISLNPGLAVRILNDNGNTYTCRIELDRQPVRVINVNKRFLRRINGDTWYNVKLEDGRTGYIFGKFIRIN